jgi:hypothetical protein
MLSGSKKICEQYLHEMDDFKLHNPNYYMSFHGKFVIT